MPKGICGQCDFWEEVDPDKADKEVREGVCCKNPPNSTGCFMPSFNKITQQVTPQLIEITSWPVTKSTKGCGGFEPKDG